MEVDHIFLRVSHNAPEAELFKHIGFIEGSSNRHCGQGTANRRFFFHNFCLELIFIDDMDECQNTPYTQIKLFERLTDSMASASPFGICFRPSKDEIPDQAPFPTWNYQPQYLPSDLTIAVAPVRLNEPMWFYLSFAIPPEQTPIPHQQPLAHPCGVNRLTHINLFMPALSEQSQAAQFAQNLPSFDICKNQTHYLELIFDQQTQKKTEDFHPTLPLIIRY
ncbi:MAG: hypothetical protein CENE_02564 [Candidatus Celerinatantimonas neptuna]|nr:MAG: hypothetical protein CENE_02564 [Candidatus Celerinatantimonas neptuna]